VTLRIEPLFYTRNQAVEILVDLGEEGWCQFSDHFIHVLALVDVDGSDGARHFLKPIEGFTVIRSSCAQSGAYFSKVSHWCEHLADNLAGCLPHCQAVRRIPSQLCHAAADHGVRR
jgi:hypothetical protein